MRIGELKKEVNKLKNALELEKASEKNMNLAVRLLETINVLNEENDLQSEMMKPMEEILSEFWNWVVHHIPYDQWQTDSQIVPWLILQQTFEKMGLLKSSFHHPILYQELQNSYDGQLNNQLSITKLMPLLIRASRLIGYAEKEGVDAYPLVQLNEMLIRKRQQESEKLKDIMFLLCSSFYLFYRYCSAEQIAYIPFLIAFRYPSTDEERRSELAIFNWLTSKTAVCLDFFNSNREHIDMRSIREVEVLKNVAYLIPATRMDFLKAIHEHRWIYFFIEKNRLDPIEGENELIEHTLQLLNIDFSTQKNQSYAAALDFVSNVKKQMGTLTDKEVERVHAAVSIFCLEQYIKQRKEDERSRYSFLSLSGETKCRTAEKKLMSILGKPVRLNFFEFIASKEGRLKNVIDQMEDQKVLDI